MPLFSVDSPEGRNIKVQQRVLAAMKSAAERAIREIGEALTESMSFDVAMTDPAEPVLMVRFRMGWRLLPTAEPPLDPIPYALAVQD